ncbi:MAG: Asp23/Gls24 family envelope stress response protein [Oscillospiraceae bacterium]|nr:Asp23/Gls24 family envelope stress response protein [Oscillospiraceae bacterium]
MPENYITVPGEKGSVYIAEDVIAVIVGTAISEVEGVAGLTHAEGPGFGEILGFKSLSRGVHVGTEGNKIIIDAAIYVHGGASIASIGEHAQKAAAGAVESMTGMDSVVNIHIAGVSFDK